MNHHLNNNNNSTKFKFNESKSWRFQRNLNLANTAIHPRMLCENFYVKIEKRRLIITIERLRI